MFTYSFFVHGRVDKKEEIPKKKKKSEMRHPCMHTHVHKQNICKSVSTY